MAKISTVGAIASILLPIGDSRMRCIFAAAPPKPSSVYPSMMTSDRMPCSRSFSFVLKPLITLLTTMSVATPSITLMMQANAR